MTLATEMKMGVDCHELPESSVPRALRRLGPEVTLVQEFVKGGALDWANFTSSTKNSTLVMEPEGTRPTAPTRIGLVFWKTVPSAGVTRVTPSLKKATFTVAENADWLRLSFARATSEFVPGIELL